MKKKIQVLVILVVVLSVFGTLSFTSKSEKKIIVIDAGHGGNDFGSQKNGVSEKQIVENIANKIMAFNANSETIKIVLLRENDNNVSLENRVCSINAINPAMLLSLHVNMSKNEDSNGVNAFVSKKNKSYAGSFENANYLLESLSGQNLKKGTVQNANFYVLRNTTCPAVLLEIGYLSNDNDFCYITNQNGQKEIAKKIYSFLSK